MPQQLIYTSAPRGIVAGRSGHCTVARSASMREALMLQLEKLSYYQHLSLSGGKERPICACRIVDIRGTRYHVLSWIQDAGLDFTSRTNFIAHHLVFTPEEIRQFPTPPVILREWKGWMKSWTKDPQLFENEDWSSLTALAAKTCLPAQTWQQVTGDAVNGFGLLDARSGATFRADGLENETVLALFAESLELLEVRDSRRDFWTTAWQYTFTTSMQEQDNPADFRWRCIYSDNPTASRFTPPDCRPITAIRAAKWSGEEVGLARNGRQSPRFIQEPQDLRITDGETARFTCKAEGVPAPTYQWFSVDRNDDGQPISGEVNPELIIKAPSMGVSRYVVRASNSVGEATSQVATLSFEPKPKLAKPVLREPSTGVRRVASYQKTEEQIENNRLRLQAQKAEELYHKRQRGKRAYFVLVLAALITAVGGTVVWKKFIAGKTAGLDQSSDRRENTNAKSLGVFTNENNRDPQPLSSQSISSAEDKRPKSPHEPEGDAPSPPPTPLPVGWTNVTIGNVSSPRIDYIKDSTPSPTFDLKAGAEGFVLGGDNLLFVCKTNDGKDFSARIFTRTNDERFPIGGVRGVMVRDSSDANSTFLFVGTCGSNVVLRCRDATSTLHPNEAVVKLSGTNLSLYLKIFSTNKAFAAAYSFNPNSAFNEIGHTIPENEHALIGFVIGSGETNHTASAHFQEFSLRR